MALLAGCAPGSTQPASDPSGSAASAAGPSKDLGSDPITIKIISTPESGTLAKDAIPGFEALHPNVTVEYTDTGFTDYNANVNLELAADNAPDIALLNQVGNTVKNGLVRSLDDYSTLYGWNKTYADTQLAQWRVGADGVTRGDGSLYAAPAGYSIVGLFYNKEHLQGLGLSAPTTPEEFDAALAKAKQAGLLPIQMGNLQAHSSFPVQLMAQSTDGAAEYAKWVFGQKGATFDTPGNRAALTALSDWAKAGYLPKGVNGTDLQGAVDAFVKGNGIFLVDGNWDAAKLDAMGDKVGFVPWPGKTVTGIGTSVAYAIATKSKHPDAAAAFLNYLASPEAGVIQFKSGFIPVNASQVQATGVRAEIVKAYDQVTKANGYVGYVVGATGTMNDTFGAVSQELIAGKNTVDDCIAAIQKDWTKVYGG